jgi:hypothetical protein
MVRVVASDIAGIERFVMTRLAAIDGVRDVSTSITLRRVQYKTVLPVRPGGGRLIQSHWEYQTDGEDRSQRCFQRASLNWTNRVLYPATRTTA